MSNFSKLIFEYRGPYDKEIMDKIVEKFMHQSVGIYITTLPTNNKRFHMTINVIPIEDINEGNVKYD
jgi:hypothetical protein